MSFTKAYRGIIQEETIKSYVDVYFLLLCHVLSLCETRVCFTGSGFIAGDLLGDLMQALELVSDEE